MLIKSPGYLGTHLNKLPTLHRLIIKLAHPEKCQNSHLRMICMWLRSTRTSLSVYAGLERIAMSAHLYVKLARDPTWAMLPSILMSRTSIKMSRRRKFRSLSPPRKSSRSCLSRSRHLYLRRRNSIHRGRRNNKILSLVTAKPWRGCASTWRSIIPSETRAAQSGSFVKAFPQKF